MRHITLALALSLGPCAVPLAVAPLHAAPPTVELTELPSRLELPLPAGTNRLFAVKIDGKPEAVWMATAAGAEARVPLQPMAGKWVFNLGDPAVAKVVAGATQFQVFARIGGETGASLPVQFVAAHKASVVVELLDGAGARLPSSGWIEPDRVATFELRWSGTGTREEAVLTAGKVRKVVQPEDGTVRAPLDDALRKAWHAAGTLELLDGEARVRRTLRAVPYMLDDAARAPFRIIQRRSLAVPGSQGFLTVHLGDISGTRVPVTLTGADGTVYFEQRLLAEGDRAEFALGAGEVRYALVIERLVNIMIGDDHAELRVEPAAARP